LFRFFTCIPRDELRYLVFDYLNDYKNIDVVNDENLPTKIQEFIKKNLLEIENIVLPERKILGPYKYNRAELILIGVKISNENITTSNNAWETFCTNQSLISKIKLSREKVRQIIVAKICYTSMLAAQRNMIRNGRDSVDAFTVSVRLMIILEKKREVTDYHS
jgi:hypothetical protein